MKETRNQLWGVVASGVTLHALYWVIHQGLSVQSFSWKRVTQYSLSINSMCINSRISKETKVFKMNRMACINSSGTISHSYYLRSLLYLQETAYQPRSQERAEGQSCKQNIPTLGSSGLLCQLFFAQKFFKKCSLEVMFFILSMRSQVQEHHAFVNKLI